MFRSMGIALGLCLVMGLVAPTAEAHVMPWRDGEARTKGFGQCAKGPCQQRQDFSAGKPHHHHGTRIVVGSDRHTWRCAVNN